MVVCDECGRMFSRHSNMLRHKENIHQKEYEDDTENEIDDTDSETDEETDSEENTSDDEESESSDEDDESVDEGEEEEGDQEADKYHLWSYLRNCAFKQPEFQVKFEDVMKQLADGQLSEKEVAEQARRVVKPDIINHICEHYSNFLKIWHFAKKDDYHRQIMRTKRRLIDDDDFEPTEAIEYAVKKRKFLITKATEMTDDTPLEDIVPTPQDIGDEEDESSLTHY